jgi:hypothetical protein
MSGNCKWEWALEAVRSMPVQVESLSLPYTPSGLMRLRLRRSGGKPAGQVRGWQVTSRDPRLHPALPPSFVLEWSVISSQAITALQ